MDERTDLQAAAEKNSPRVDLTGMTPTVVQDTAIEYVGMNIRQAKEFFQKYQNDLEPDYANLVRLFRKQGIDEAIPNSNYLHALGLIDGMFSETSRSLRMLTGNASEAVPSLLFGPFEKMLLRIKKNGGSAKVIVVDGSASGLDPLKGKYPDTLDVALGTATKGSRISHFIVCDSDLVREEEYHVPLNDDSSADLIKAKVYCANKGKATALSLLFDGIWKKLTTASS
jgi:hypothetical protein